MQKKQKKRKGETSNDAEHRLLKNILDHVADPIFVKDRNHRWTYGNQAFWNMLGQKPQAMLGKSDYDFFPKEEADVFWKKDNKVFQTGKTDINEESLTDARGKQHIISTKKTRFFNDKKEAVLVGIIRDVTDLKQVERLKNEFISMVSHELRTPLSSIRGALGLLATGALGRLPAEAATLMEIAHRNSERLVHLVNEILDLEKIESGKLRLKIDSVPVAEFLRLAIEENSIYGEKYGVAFELGKTPQKAFVAADVNRLMQVMANLLSNAAKFSPRGSKVTLSAMPLDKDKVCFEVMDRGMGIPKAFHASIFNKFSQLDTSNTRKHEGAGLGLSITKKLVEAMDGSIAFRSKEGKGTVFTVKLPSGQSKASTRQRRAAR